MRKNYKLNLQGKTTKRKALIKLIMNNKKNFVTKYPFVMEISSNRDISFNIATRHFAFIFH